MEVDEVPHDPLIDEIREKHRHEVSERRKEQKLHLLSIKRRWTVEDQSELKISVDKVYEISKQLKKSKKIDGLRYLSQAFSTGDEFITAFLSVDGALYSLISCLTGKDDKLQIEAMNCLINLSSGSHKSTFTCVKATSAYLFAYLGSGNICLQEKCLWCIANFAADCVHCSEILRVQGFVPTVKQFLQSSNLHLRYDAYFAFSCYISTRKQIDEEILTNETLTLCLQPFTTPDFHLETTTEAAMIIFHLTTKSNHDSYLVSAGTLEKTVFGLSKIIQFQPSAITVTTILLRILANLSSGAPIIINRLVTQSEIGIIIQTLLHSTYNHLIKESLWLLSNICGDIHGISLIIQTEGLLKRVIDLSENIGEISLQSLICLCNITSLNSVCCDRMIINFNIFDILNRLLQRLDEVTTKRVLRLIVNLSKNCSLSRQDLILRFGNLIVQVESMINCQNRNIQLFAREVVSLYKGEEMSIG